MEIDFLKWVNEFKSVSDTNLRGELKKIDFKIDEKKFRNSISAFGGTFLLNSIPKDDFKKYMHFPDSTPDTEVLYAQWIGSCVLRAYTAFVYMRSQDLETGLSQVDDLSAIRPFRDFFVSGNIKKGKGSIGQHIRNSLSHGTFSFEAKHGEFYILFKDKSWEASCDFGIFYDGVCNQIKRVYFLAYEIKHGIQQDV